VAEGVIFDVKRMSIDDGPGFRTVAFLKGCPLRCIWCHSPESMYAKPELVFYESRCIGCGRCIESCPTDVYRVSEAHSRVIVRERCIACGKCARECYAGALDIKGTIMSSRDLYAELVKDKVFYEVSRGGVTFSGGEPMFQPEFLLDTLRMCKAGGIHTAVDTSGYAKDYVVQELMPYVDLFLYDLKCMDEEKHKQYTGVSNAMILGNLRMLAEGGKEIHISVPAIPGFNTSFENVAQTMRLMRDLEIRTMRLLSFNKMAGSKYEWQGRSFPLEDIIPMGEEWSTRVKELGAEFNIDVILK
jgi:pyruvate formate lyase activating enzyme